MSNKFSLKATASIFFASLIIFSGLASAQQIEGGNIYRVRNVTKGTDFMDPANADKCETLQYRVRIHNPGPGSFLSQVNVRVTLPGGASTSNVSTVVVSAQNASPSSTSDTATVNLSAPLSISYISGSTQLLDSNNAVISSLPDGITSGGVNIGNVGLSIEQRRSVQFQAKVDCPQPPPPPVQPPPPPQQPPPPPAQPPAPTPPPAAPAVVVTQAAPAEIPAAGPEDTILAFLSIAAASTTGYYIFIPRIRSLLGE